jgi:hypothetical protein
MSIDQVLEYIQRRIAQADEYIAAEALAGNAVKEQTERAVKAELVGLIAFISNGA